MQPGLKLSMQSAVIVFAYFVEIKPYWNDLNHPVPEQLLLLFQNLQTTITDSLWCAI